MTKLLKSQLIATRGTELQSRSIQRSDRKASRTQTRTKPAPTTPRAPSQNNANLPVQQRSATPNKLQIIVALLRQKRGASIDHLARATGWQKHSVRGAMFGAIKIRLGLTVTSERKNDVRMYRIGK